MSYYQQMKRNGADVEAEVEKMIQVIKNQGEIIQRLTGNLEGYDADGYYPKDGIGMSSPPVLMLPLVDTAEMVRVFAIRADGKEVAWADMSYEATEAPSKWHVVPVEGEG